MIKKTTSSFSLKAMTLVELLVVVSLIAFLATMAVVIYKKQVFKGVDAKRKGDLHKIQVALEEYEKDHNCYPDITLVVCEPGKGLVPYLEKIPCDPSTKTSYLYDYESSDCPKWYRIFVKLDDAKDVDITKAGCSYGCGPDSSSLTYNYYLSSPNAPLPSMGTSEGGVVVSTPPGGDAYYGCKDKVCVQVPWDPARPGPLCNPNYLNIPDCFGQCGNPGFECVNWR